MNKKLFFGMFAAASMLFATSCSNDELEAVRSGNEAQVTFSLGLEGGIATRAISDGTGADRLVYAVFDEDGARISTIAAVDKETTFPTTETLTLAKGQTYQVAFWAQDSDCDAYTVDTDNMTVSVNYTDGTVGSTSDANNDETRDAFFKTIEFTVNGSTSLDVVLKRPFAQINVGVTAEDWDAAVASGIEIEKSAVVIKNAANQIDLLTGAVTGNQTVTYALNAIPTETLSVETDNTKEGKEEYKWLSMSYILVNDGSNENHSVDGTQKTTLESLQFTFAPKNGKSIAFAEGLHSVPVQRNYRTNILGKILTGDIQFNITIDPAYDGDYIYPDGSVEQELEFAATFGGKVTLSGDASLKAPLNVTADMILDLNGHTIKGEGISNDAVISADGATLTIKGDNGTISTTGAYPLGVKNGGTLVVESGKFTATNSTQALYVWKGTANIKGGYFEVESKYNGTSYVDDNGNGKYVLNCPDASYKDGSAKIIVTGGTFYKFDPANNVAEGAKTNFCAEGYASSKVGDTYIVSEEEKKFVSTVQDFEDALANPEINEIVLTKDITLGGGLTFGAAVSTLSTRSASTTLAGRDIVIDGNESTITFESVPSGRLIDVRKEAVGVNFTLKNVTLLNNVSWVERGINYNTNGTLTLDNVTIKSEGNSTMNYAVNLPANSANATVIIKDSNIGATANALNLWGEKTTVNVTNSDLYIIDNNEKESYAVIALNNDGTNAAEYSVVTVTGGSVKVTGTYPDESNAVRNSTINGNVNISATTEVVGDIREYIAIVYYEGHNNFYSFSTLQGALDKAVKDGAGAGVRMIRSINECAVNTKAPYGNYYGVKHDGVIFDGNGNTLDFELGKLNDKGQADNYGIMTSGGTIKNMTITGVFRGIMIMNPTETVYIDNVTIGDKDVCYAINTSEGDGTQDLVVTNSTIKGWSSYGTAIKSVSFKDCTFAQGEYYKDVFGRLVKPYVDCVFENCEFSSKFYIDLSALTTDGDGNVVNPDAKITLKNCTVNGVKLTKDNWKQLIAAESSCGEGQISIELKDGSYLTADKTVDYVVFE